MGVAENIDALLVKFDITAESLARIAGVQPPTVSRWRHGAMPREEPIKRITDYFGLERDDIVSDAFGLAAKEHGCGVKESIRPIPSSAAMPVVGDVAAGDPCEAIELIDQMLTVPEVFLESHPGARFLRVRGESMNKLFQADTFVLYDPDLPVRHGDIAVVYVNGDDATVKRVFFAGDTVVLHPESTMDEHLDRAINTKDPSSPPVTFAGRVFWATWGDKDMRF